VKTETALLLVAGLFLLTQRRKPENTAPPPANSQVLQTNNNELPNDAAGVQSFLFGENGLVQSVTGVIQTFV